MISNQLENKSKTLTIKADEITLPFFINKSNWDNYYKCSIIYLEEEKMFISQPCYIKVDDKVKLVKVYKIYDLIYGSGDTLELIDDEGNIFLRKYWEINAVVKKELKPLNPEKIKLIGPPRSREPNSLANTSVLLLS